MMKYTFGHLNRAHNRSFKNRKEVERSTFVGCFNCRKIIKTSDVSEWEWVDDDDTAMCPVCGMDSVIGDKSGYEINKDFLKAMHNQWLGTSLPLNLILYIPIILLNGVMKLFLTLKK